MLKVVNMFLICYFGFLSFFPFFFQFLIFCYFWFSLLFSFSLPIFSQRKRVSCLIKCFHILNFADCTSWCHFKCVPIPLFPPQWWLDVEAWPDLGLIFWQDYFTNGMVYSHEETHVIWFLFSLSCHMNIWIILVLWKVLFVTLFSIHLAIFLLRILHSFPRGRKKPQKF